MAGISAMSSASRPMSSAGGCHVIGLCGSEEKARALTDQLGFHGAVNYKASPAQLRESIRAALPVGRTSVDVFWDSVGGELSHLIVSELVAAGGQVVLCGAISGYDSETEYPPPLPADVAQHVAEHDIRRKRYLVLQHKRHFAEGLAELCRLVASGRLQAPETRWYGLGAAPTAFCEMMGGANVGKAVVECAPLPPRAARLNALRAWLPASLRGAACSRWVHPHDFEGLL